MAISFVDSTVLTFTDNNTSFQISRPSGLQSGDFLISAVAHFSSAGEDPEQVSVTAPSGWTKVSDIFSSGVNSIQLTVFTKTAGSSEPSTWSGSYGDTQSIEASVCAAYRGVSGLAVTDTSTAGGSTSLTLGSISNPQSNNWRVVIGAYASNSVVYAIESNEVVQRENGFVEPEVGVEIGLWDSNGTVSTGSHSRNITRDAVWGTAAGWLAILDATDTAIPGTLNISALPKPTASFSGSISHTATLAATLPLPTMTASGIATPPAGPLDISIVPVVTNAAFTDSSGSMDISLAPIMDIRTETRASGVLFRVVTPKAETRVIRPRLGAAD